MATNMITTCDHIRTRSGQSHGVPAHTVFRATLDGKEYEADMCRECVPELQAQLARLGIRPSIALVDGKPRGAYVTASGRSFTTAEAREWLVDEGYEVNPVAGRVSREMLDAFAAAH